MKKQRKKSKRRKIDLMHPICWIIVPTVTVVLIVLDAIGIYTFNNERLMVFGICLIVILLPFFSEITLKELSVKRSKTRSGKDT